MTEKLEVARAARRLLVKCYAHLDRLCPDGDYERYVYYRMELKYFLEILNDIAKKKHPFGKYLIGNGTEGRKLENIGSDLFTQFACFLVNGTLTPRGGKIATMAYIQDAKANHYEHLAIHEMLGAYIKKVKPGIERYYYRME